VDIKDIKDKRQEVACKLRNQCKRYLPDPPDAPLWWVPVEYREETRTCVHFESLD